jgi:MFS family permease
MVHYQSTLYIDLKPGEGRKIPVLVALSDSFHIFKVLRSRPFTLLWVGQFISFVGDYMFRIALAWEVLLLTGSATAMGIVVIASLAPTIVFVLIGGVTADRLPRRLIMLSSDAGRAIVVLLITLLTVMHLLQFWHLVALSLLFGVVDGFFAPAYRSIAPQLVEKEMLQSANSLTQMGTLMSGLFGPTLGAICVAVAGPASAFALDGLSFLVSVGCLLAMRIPHTSQPQTDIIDEKQVKQQGLRGVLVDIREGLRYVTGSSWLWVTITIASVANITFFGPMAVALPKLVHDVYGTGAWLYGVISTADALGALIATIIIGQMRHLRKRGLLAYTALLISCSGLLVLGLPFPRMAEPIIAPTASFFMGLGLGVFQVIWVTILQELIPTDKLGRVSSIDMMGSYVLLPLGIAIVGVLTDRFGPALMFIGGGTLSLALIAMGFCVRSIRELE